MTIEISVNISGKNSWKFLTPELNGYRGEKEKTSPFTKILKGEDTMNPQIKQGEWSSVEQFDTYMKKALKGAARNYYKKDARRGERLMYFSELSQDERARLALSNSYNFDDSEFCFEAEVFDVLGESVFVYDCDIAEALESLPSKTLEVALLYIFAEMKDPQIAEHLSVPRSTVAYHRTKAVEVIKAHVERPKS